MVLRDKLLLIICLPNVLLAQPLIQNPSFENCHLNNQDQCQNIPGTPSCSNVPYHHTQFVHVANWKSICSVDWYKDDPAFFDMTNGDPSRYCNSNESIDAHSGSHYVGLYNQEAIIYDFGNNLQKGFYKLRFWTKSCEPDWKIEVFGSDAFPEANEPCGIKVGNNDHLYSLHTQTFGYRDYWQEVVINLETYSKDIKYIIIMGDKHGFSCFGADYFFVDDVVMESLGCCQPYELFQNTIIPTSNTERMLYIKAGTNVDNYQAPGPVLVQAGNTVRFKAGNYISLETGFNVELGAVFIAEIGPCAPIEGPIDMYVAIPNAYTPNCDGVNDYFCLYTKNVSYYKLVYTNRLGNERVYEGLVNTEVTVSNGYNETCFEFPVVQGTWVNVFYFQGWGCNNAYYYETGNITAIDAVTGCGEAWKTDAIDSLNQTEELETIIVSPNPFCGWINVSCSSLKPNSYITVNDIQGREVMKVFIERKVTTLDLSNFQNGVYLLNIFQSSNSYVTKVNKLCD